MFFTGALHFGFHAQNLSKSQSPTFSNTLLSSKITAIQAKTSDRDRFPGDAELDSIIMEARTSVDQTYRKGLYKEALDIVLDWAVEVPVYQRKDAVLTSVERVNMDTMTKDLTPYWTWLAEIDKIAMN